MLIVLYVLQFIIAVLLVLFIFMQKRSESTGLLTSNSYNDMFKSMSVPANPFVKITLIIGILFFLNSIVISAVLLKKNKEINPLVEKAAKYYQSHNKKEAKHEKSIPTKKSSQNTNNKKLGKEKNTAK